ncbi:hypothetical protein DCCM_3490 [Desulfocucumis palustris]|uniref:Uncharacterized protein n=1 Tax=Desulfocucumis palustris TaxID=1898651 RepID=A0A2L2XDR4_9FIRM|nr:hypothetical protein DCCM_3490 [Desulfocucumis palustris]
MAGCTDMEQPPFNFSRPGICTMPGMIMEDFRNLSQKISL